jgi:hypothetical protein
MESEFKPCPFCGDSMDLEFTDSACVISMTPRVYKRAVYCNTCFCEGPPALTDKKAKDSWNKRAENQHGK